MAGSLELVLTSFLQFSLLAFIPLWHLFVILHLRKVAVAISVILRIKLHNRVMVQDRYKLLNQKQAFLKPSRKACFYFTIKEEMQYELRICMSKSKIEHKGV